MNQHVSSPVTVLLLLRRFDSNDGVASYCETLIRGLAGRGDRVVMVSGPVTELYGSSGRRQAVRDMVLDWVVLDGFANRVPRPSLLRRIAAVMCEHRVEVISPQGLSLLPIAYCLGRLSGHPVVANYHPSMGAGTAAGVATRRSGRKILAYRLLLTIFPPARLIAISKDIHRFFHIDCAVALRRIVHIVNGVDLQMFRPPTPAEIGASRAKLNISIDTLVCVLSGRLNFVKGHDVAIDAVRSLRQTRPGLRIVCLFPGAGDQGAEIKAYALKDEVDDAGFRFVGFVADVALLREIYWASDIALLPSRFEGSPIFIAEAMSCGCVAIRTPSGGWEDQIVDGVNGFVVPFSDPPALAERIDELSHFIRRKAMREKAIEFAIQNFDQARMVEATSDVYRSVCV